MLKIAVTGRFRRGKDTLVGMLTTLIDGNFTYLAFADELKREVHDMALNAITPVEFFDIRDGKPVAKPGAYEKWHTYMLRQKDINGPAYQWWGAFRRRYFGINYWINHPNFRVKYQEGMKAGEHIIIADMRHHNESAWCEDNGFYRIRVEGPCHGKDDRDPNHESERDIESLKVDYVIDNSGTYNDLIGNLPMLIDSLKLRFGPAFKAQSPELAR